MRTSVDLGFVIPPALVCRRRAWQMPRASIGHNIQNSTKGHALIFFTNCREPNTHEGVTLVLKIKNRHRPRVQMEYTSVYRADQMQSNATGQVDLELSGEFSH